MKKLIFLVVTKKYEMIMKLKYLVQIGGMTLMLYYYAREIKISLNPLNDNMMIKLSFVLTHSFFCLLSDILFTSNHGGCFKHKLRFKCEYLVIASLFINYTLAYSTCDIFVTYSLYNLALIYHIYRYFLMKNSLPFLEELNALVNNQSNFDLLVNLNMEDQMRQVTEATREAR
jgi:hypothetical protein